MSLVAGGRALGGLGSPQRVSVNAYLTDGVFLYRVVDLLQTAKDELVELEDCYGLDVVRIPLRALRTRQLRRVTPLV